MGTTTIRKPDPSIENILKKNAVTRIATTTPKRTPIYAPNKLSKNVLIIWPIFLVVVFIILTWLALHKNLSLSKILVDARMVV